MQNIHPFLVHFPVALLTVSVLADILAFSLRKAPLHGFAWWLQIVGVISLLGAVLTGLQAGEAAVITEPAIATFQSHQQLAFAGAAAFLTLFLWRGGKRGEIPKAFTGGYIALEVLAMSLLLAAAWYGGELVFRYGVGVR